MACDYCRGERNLLSRGIRLSLKGDFYPGIELSIDGNKMYVASVADTYEPNFMEEDFKIYYCPMCGQKLGR